MKDKETKYTREPLECRHCGNRAPFRMVDAAQQKHLIDEETGDSNATIYQLLECPSCEKIMIQMGFWDDAMDETDWEPEIIYPSENKRVEGLPPAVERAYEAARKVRGIDVNAFAVLLGRVLDHVCSDRGAAGKTLFEKLDDLAKRNEIPERLAKMASSLRSFRNVGAHADLGSLSPAEVPFLDDLCRALLEYVYSAPGLIDAAEARLRKLKKSPESRSNGCDS